MNKKIWQVIILIIAIIVILFLSIILFPRLITDLDQQSAEKIIDFINFIHTPYYYISFTAVCLIPLGFLPRKMKFESRIDKFYSYVILFFLFHITTVFVSQGFIGGCVYTIPQHHFAHEYLGYHDWFILGLAKQEVFEKFISEENYDILYYALRLFYLIFGVLFIWITARFYVYRIYKVKL